MRNRFDAQLEQLNVELIEMGARCEEVISLAAKALIEGDAAIAGRVGPIDAEIDRMEREIENLCLRLLLQQQPVARDLRQISAALKMITDMERIGDQADDIAEIIGFLNGHSAADCAYIGEMANETKRMVTGSVDAYVKRDLELAVRVMEQDDVVDALFQSVKASLIEMIREKPEEGVYALDLLMIAKYFERIGDHAVNIAEWVEFSLTGVHRGEEQ
ncbi:MAG: phosphate signaling complex protein PhoU [Clostridia bacterium]|nr:phosphate signaling complex protein PhoU [Clostridia bacterium]